MFFDSAASRYEMGHELAVHHYLHRMARIVPHLWDGRRNTRIKTIYPPR